MYGAYYRKMSKQVQKELAEANAVAEEALSSMTTVSQRARGSAGWGSAGWSHWRPHAALPHLSAHPPSSPSLACSIRKQVP